MHRDLPPITFYIDDNDLPKAMPSTFTEYKEWLGENRSRFGGRFYWILATGLLLRESGFPCTITTTFPNKGIIIAHYDSLSFDGPPPDDTLLVCVQADRAEHPQAQLHVVQNPSNYKVNTGNSFFIPHWPEPLLLPRLTNRKDSFQNVCYFGWRGCLTKELQSEQWVADLNKLGLTWNLASEEQCLLWPDYRCVDVIVAVRSFKVVEHKWVNKPASKLYNAWIAGVPAILGRESAYQMEKRSILDYIEVGSYQEALSALRLLRDDCTLRHRIVENGLTRAMEVSYESILGCWKEFLVNVTVPRYHHSLR